MIIQELPNVKFSMTDKEKLALGLMIESILKPDQKLRGCAHNQGCYNELMDWREKILNLLYQYEKPSHENFLTTNEILETSNRL